MSGEGIGNLIGGIIVLGVADRVINGPRRRYRYYPRRRTVKRRVR
jgi:hypothetical protein